ncbi:unnamed protein product [Durusdinium trenchii]|uniref:Uncharacterized protein n=1 Tax=Durusdinium trenchii TaxID=1381693 RepID=A0ABP0MMB4_9DINO|eukprot:g30319.t1
MSKAAKANQAPSKIAESSFGAEDEALGQGLPAHWTIEALDERVQSLLESYLSSAKSDDAIKNFKDMQGTAGPRYVMLKKGVDLRFGAV